jgi:hypothetical protein
MPICMSERPSIVFTLMLLVLGTAVPRPLCAGGLPVVPPDTTRSLWFLHGSETEAEFFIGREGYRHGGLNFSREAWGGTIGISAHLVQEGVDEPVFPSLGLEIGRELSDALEVGVFTFGYLPTEGQHAWALGAHATHAVHASPAAEVRVFANTVYARVQATDLATAEAESVGHGMIFGGLQVERGGVMATVFGSRSGFDRDPYGLETHVDMGEMTHFAAYENTDGFASASLGAEVTASWAERFRVTATYARMRFDGHAVRRSAVLRPSVRVGRFELFTGVQLLRGGRGDNDIAMVGIARSW